MKALVPINRGSLLLPGFVLATSLIFQYCGDPMTQTDSIMAPKAEKITKELTQHGHIRIDNYYWLNERENTKVIDYLNQENEYLNAKMKHTLPLQDKLYDEIVGRIKKTDNSVPVLQNGFFYYVRYEETGEYPIYCREKANGVDEQLEEIMEALKGQNERKEEEVLLNVNEMAKGHEFFDVSTINISTNNFIMAYGVDTVGRRQYSLHFKDLKTGELLSDVIPNTTGGVTWANDNSTVFYSTKDHTLRAYKIIKHVLGTVIEKDELVYHEEDDTFGTYIYKTKSKKFLVIGS